MPGSKFSYSALAKNFLVLGLSGSLLLTASCKSQKSLTSSTANTEATQHTDQTSSFSSQENPKALRSQTANPTADQTSITLSSVPNPADPSSPEPETPPSTLQSPSTPVSVPVQADLPVSKQEQTAPTPTLPPPPPTHKPTPVPTPVPTPSPTPPPPIQSKISVAIDVQALAQNPKLVANPQVRAGIPSHGYLLPETENVLQENDTPYSVLMRLAGAQGIKVTAQKQVFGVYVSAIQNIAEKSAGPRSGWTYEVNGIQVQVASDQYVLQPGDRLVWKFVIGN